MHMRRKLMHTLASSNYIINYYDIVSCNLFVLDTYVVSVTFILTL